MKKYMPIVVAGLVVALVTTPALAKGAGGHDAGGGMGSGMRNPYAATPAIPPQHPGETAIPAMPSNPRAQEEVQENRQDDSSLESGDTDSPDSSPDDMDKEDNGKKKSAH